MFGMHDLAACEFIVYLPEPKSNTYHYHCHHDGECGDVTGGGGDGCQHQQNDVEWMEESVPQK